MEYVFQLVLMLAQLVIMLVEYTERKQCSTNKKTSSDDEIITVSIKKN